MKSTAFIVSISQNNGIKGEALLIASYCVYINSTFITLVQDLEKINIQHQKTEYYFETFTIHSYDLG